MINRVVLVGRLVKDPVLTYTPSGIASCRFTIAVNRTFSNQAGEREADFISCVAWRKQAENLANFMKKGSLIGAEGRIQTGSYEKDGQRIYTTDVMVDSVQFLEPRGNQDGVGQTQQQQPNYNNGQTNGGQYQQQQPARNQSNQSYTRVEQDPFANSKGPIEVSEDDLPF